MNYKRIFILLFITSIILLYGNTSSAFSKTSEDEVLIINSYNKDFPWTDQQTASALKVLKHYKKA